MEKKLIRPPFTEETARQKVKNVEEAWNSKDPVKVAEVYTLNTEWRNKDRFIFGRDGVLNFLYEEWGSVLDYTFKKELWAFTDNIMAIRCEYEYQSSDGQWYRAYGNEICEFSPNGLMKKRYARFNDFKITAAKRKLKTMSV